MNNVTQHGINEAETLPNPSTFKGGIGCLEIALCWAFYYLHKEINYKDAIFDILMKGGDTDTNAAIVGGLLGAWQGISQIPQEWTIKILNFRSVAQPG